MSYLGFGLADPSLCPKGCDQLREEAYRSEGLLVVMLNWSPECRERWNTQCTGQYDSPIVEAEELVLTVPKKTTSTATTASTVAPSAGAPVLLMAAVAVGAWLMFK